MKLARNLILLSSLIVGATAQSQQPNLSLKRVFELAVQNSRDISASTQAQAVSQYDVSIAKTNYFPNLKAEGLDTTGFPGSSGALGVRGLMGSAYRSGWAYGLVATQDLWDFGQTSRAITEAKKRVQVSMEITKLHQLQVMEHALELYANCSLDNNLLGSWKNLAHESDLIFHEVAKYVRTGQRSIVEQMLVESQLQDANSQIVDFQARLSFSRKRLKEYLGLAKSVECPATIQEASQAFAITAPTPAEHPLISRAKAELHLAQAEVSNARSGYLPKLVAIGSVGDMEATRFVSAQDYSAGIGLIIPVFDSDLTNRRVEKAESYEYQKNLELQAAQQSLTDLNLAIDRLVAATQAKFNHLKIEQDLAQRAFKLAKIRYTSQRGTLVDLREAFRNLSRTTTAVAAVQTRMLAAKAERALYDGAWQLK